MEILEQLHRNLEFNLSRLKEYSAYLKDVKFQIDTYSARAVNCLEWIRRYDINIKEIEDKIASLGIN